MARGINKVIIVGNLGEDPQVRYMPDGTAVATLQVATNEQWKDKNTGEKKERTEWHRVALFSKTAEVAGEYLRKGSQVYIEGKNRTRKWTDNNGIERYTTEVVVDVNGKMQMLGGGQGYDQGQRKQNQQGGGQNNYAAVKNQQQRGSSHSNSPQQNHEPPIDFDDDIPF